MRHILRFFFIIACLSHCSTTSTSGSSSGTGGSSGGTSDTATGFTTSDNKIYDDGEEIHLFGVNWFGMETSNYVLHGLWTRNHTEMVEQIKEMGFNAVRLPFCPSTLQGVATSSISSSANPDLEELTSLETMDLMMQEFNDYGIYILLDHHRPDCNAISELWYTSDYTEEEWIDDLVFVAERYADLPYFMGIDLKNEPHGSATWGSGDDTTDWDSAAERAAAEVMAINPNILIFVEGIQENETCSDSDNAHWWGGNLEPINCYPLDIDAEKLVLSPHVYGPDVYNQSYFDDSNFPNNMPTIWDTQFGSLIDDGYTIVPGEFGGKYGDGDPDDVTWQDSFVDYLIDNQICSFFYWSLNPNSGDTGGILEDDWETVNQDKLDNLQRLMTACEL